MLATLTLLSLVAATQDAQPNSPASLYQSLEAVADRMPYIDPNTVPTQAKFHSVELKPSKVTFGRDEILAFRFDAIPDAGRRALVLGWKVKGIKKWGIWSRHGPEDVLEQFEEVRPGSDLVVGKTETGALVGSREYIIWFRVKAGSPTNVPLSLNMYDDEEMLTRTIDSPASFTVLSTEQDEADETDPWDLTMTGQTKVAPVATVLPLPALDENHLLFDTEGATSFAWSPFEYLGRKYVSLTVNLGTGHLFLGVLGPRHDGAGA